jgi:flagellar protein FlbD
VIFLHRLGHRCEPFQLNPDLIVTVEATPDTVVTLTTGSRFVVAETPEEVGAIVRAWHVGVLSEALSTAGAAPLRAAVSRQGGGRSLYPVEGASAGADQTS